MVFCSQSWLPEIPSKGVTPSTVTRRKSKSCSESDFHQKCSLVTPVTVVENEVLWLLPMAPLWAASEPSCVVAVWPAQAGALDVKLNGAASRASGRLLV